MGFLSGLFGGGYTNPYTAGIKTYKPFGNQLRPYMDEGQFALGRENSAANNMTGGNGTDQINNIMAQYKESPYAKYQTGQATAGANAAAAASGLVGTPQEQHALASDVSGIVSHDQQNYLQNALGQYNRGVGELDHLGGMGYDATNHYGQYLGNLAGMQAQQAHAENQHNANMRNNFLGMLGDAGGIAAHFV